MGPGPGRQQSDGAGLFVLGERFGNVFVGIQPAFGWEGDPMRLLFEKSFAPTHAFSAFYRYLREDFGADAVLHFGTHGALEFMPGKQAGLSARSWPDRLIGDLPNFYLYAANNPSEGALAKRRSAATLVSYRTPALTQAGLYRGLLDLKASIDRWRLCDPVDVGSRKALAELIQAQASAVELCPASPAFTGNLDVIIAKLAADVLELEYALIPHGLHVVGRPPARRSAWTSSPASARRATASRRTATRLPPSSAARASSGRSQATASPPTTPPARPGRSSPPPTGCSPPRPRSVASSPPSTAPSSAPPPAATC